jgi:lactoylglutathione lyase
MKEITRINHVGLRIKSLDSSRGFYEELGFVFIAGPVGPEPVAIMAHPSGATLNLILNASDGPTLNMLMDLPEKHTGYTHMALEVNDLESVQKQLKDFDIAVTEGPVTMPGGATSLFIRDPDDNVIEFHKPA